ncbi:MAG TPA: diacylglycerol kinase family protein [Allosphingosinicella sp.]|jgi:diacylglycerol kinase family enzyme|nr:diacylglycerol kinase family protein [Allosphingosinicella sp.]
MARVALLSNPRSTGNRSLLPRVRSYCARQKDIFHYEVEHVSQIGAAMRTIARVQPKVLVINGGDGTVQAALTEMFNGGHFGDNPPPVAVLPNGKTNLIAYDLGSGGDPIAALERVIEIARSDLDPHIVRRELISLSDGSPTGKRVVGMFLGGAGLADTMLFCRHHIYPLGLPTGFAHALTFVAALVAIVIGVTAKFLPPRPSPVRVSLPASGSFRGRFAVLMVTTLDRMLLNDHFSPSHGSRGALSMLLVEQRRGSVLRAILAAVRGRLGRLADPGVHVGQTEEVRIEGEESKVILDGELFQTRRGRPIVLRSTAPMSFLRLAA